MHQFNIIKNRLFCEDLAIEDIAQTVPTPFYLYSKKAITESFCDIKDSFAALDPLICYSIKSNSSLAIMKLLKKLGSGFDIVSGGELFRCKRIGTDMRKVVYAGVGKRDDEIAFALKAGILMFNCESINEIRRINMIANQTGKKARIAVRLNPDVDAKTHHYITTGKKETKFGITFDALESYLPEIQSMESIELTGIHIHIGSQITTPAPYKTAITRALRFVDILRKQGFNIQTFNMGGGFGIPYNKEKDISASDFAKIIVPLLKGKGLKIIMEPGRFIIGNACALITRVLYIKDGIKKHFVITDAGMHNLIRPSLYEAWHTITPAVISGKKTMKADIVGPVCESTDFFAKDRTLPVLKERDILAILSAGAYGMSMSSRYNSHPIAAELMVDNGKIRVIRKAEHYGDMIRNEVP